MTTTYIPVIRDEAIEKVTKRNWSQWFTLLDKANATELTHMEIARFLYDQYLPKNSWWCQMIANNYERARGMKQKYEAKDGYQVTITKTLPLPITQVFKMFISDIDRDTWLGKGMMDIQKAIPNTIIRGIWNESGSRLSIVLTEKGSTKSQITLEHRQLKDGEEAETMKKFWKEKLGGIVQS